MHGTSARLSFPAYIDSKLSTSRTFFPMMQTKQSSKTTCWCSKVDFLHLSSSEVLPAKLDNDKISKQLQDAEKEQLQIDRGGGRCVDEISINECNRSFIKEFYPNLVEETNSWPLVFQPKHPSESSFDMKAQLGKEDGRVGNRIGDEAEQKTFETFVAMFKHNNIASFTLSQYRWMKYLPHEIFHVLKKIPEEGIVQKGESDLLVLLPERGVIAIEVKSKENSEGLEGVIEKCFEQCKKAITFVACSTLDIVAENKVWFVKLVSLPDSLRLDIESMTCKKCSPHFITKEDLISTSTLFEWFEKFVNLYKDWQLNSKVYESMVARFIGPLSRVEVKLPPEVINDTHENLEKYGSHEQIKSKWVQLNKEQSETVFENPGFLWITGDPGSGKTVLALWKVQEMFRSVTNENHVIYLIPGNRDMLVIKNMEMLFRSHLTGNETGTVLKVKSIEDIFSERSDWNGLKGLLAAIRRLTSLHEESQVSILLDEFWFHERDKLHQQNISCNDINENLKSVWIVQSSSCKVSPEISALELLRFNRIYFERIMRMSEQNVKFLNFCLNTDFKVGHAIQGPLPILYKMKCICEKVNAEDELICIPFLIRRLTEEVLANLKTLANENVEMDISEDVVVITKMHVKVKKFLSQGRLEVIVRPALFFTGCEKKLVIVDLRNVGGSSNYESNLIEALTRATGRLVLLDVSCKHDRQGQEEVKRLVGRINKVPDTVLERGKDVNFNTTEISVLKRDINLGLFRDEQDIQENMASAVTGKMLQETIKPLKEDIKEVKSDISTIKKILQRMETSNNSN